MIYGAESNRRLAYRVPSFDFRGYTFRSRKSPNRPGASCTGFRPVVRPQAAQAIRAEIRSGWCTQPPESGG